MTRMVPDDDPDWLAFWAAYPRKEAKKDARKAWIQVVQPPRPGLVAMILDALAWQVPMRQWDGVKREFCPLPGTWLRGERWTDEQPPPVVPKGLPAWAVKQ